jgi:hypothetical protein
MALSQQEAALILFIIALIITLAIAVPIDNQIRTWTTKTVPADWQGILPAPSTTGYPGLSWRLQYLTAREVSME